MNIQCVRIYSDPMGETHLEHIEIPMVMTNFAPPVPPIEVSAFMPAAQVGFLHAPAGMFGDWHPAPRRQLVCYLSGETEGQVSDGSTIRLGPGAIVLLEDTTGKGHTTRVLSGGVSVVIQLP